MHLGRRGPRSEIRQGLKRAGEVHLVMLCTGPAQSFSQGNVLMFRATTSIHLASEVAHAFASLMDV